MDSYKYPCTYCGGKDQHESKGPWSKEEDRKLTAFFKNNGVGKWKQVPKACGIFRCGRSCRSRWLNHLLPSIKRGYFSDEEDEHIINLHNALGNRWASIAKQIPGRTAKQIRNHWKCMKMQDKVLRNQAAEQANQENPDGREYADINLELTLGLPVNTHLNNQ